ncbi:PadR family transcriptional regulator [Desulfoscipio gibsoniae]|uniref:Putative transcriptional regulator n=1 Tax=Desulfoscipio gibsoniae DSM 7213 TaxID=767817 RepID=R4KHW2_9FIRM|nr:PadR family transcriptional regulator [Desulfoscipio gibsoniae]AGL02803.1 putative transcriptional regulator [Desulfoscipio gibsoniae DSM 7213]
MNVSKYLPLTETTFYIMLALRKAGHGYAVMQKVEELSKGRVRIAAGTMYGAIENLMKQKMIVSVPSEDARRKVYQLSPMGHEILALEVERLKNLVEVYEQTESEEV